MSEDEWDDDTPSADPQIQKDYQLAVGEFLVRFNRIENSVSDIVVLALEQLKRPELIKKCRNVQLRPRMQNLELILLAFPKVPNVPIAEIEKLAEDRNKLAHGHFEQNPFSGAYEIVGKGNSNKISPQDIGEMGTRADEIWTKLRSIEIHFAFTDFS